MKVSNALLVESMKGLQDVGYSDRKLAMEQGRRHIRSGKLSKAWGKRYAGTEILAIGFDELGNGTIVNKEGYMLQL